MRSLIIGIMSSLLALSLTGCERYALDRQMEALCKKDGGIKVYETVTLSPDEYERILFGSVILAKSQEDYYGTEYRFLSQSEHLVGKDGDAERGRGELIRHYSAVYRKSDNRLLGESIRYARGGGDFFTFGFQPSGNSCPRLRVGLGHSIFVKGE
jgi:hypothetical protein